MTVCSAIVALRQCIPLWPIALAGVESIPRFANITVDRLQTFASNTSVSKLCGGTWVLEFYQPVRDATMYNYWLTLLNEIVAPQAQLFETLGSESEDEGAL